MTALDRLVCLVVMAGHPMALTYPSRLFETAVMELTNRNSKQKKR